MSGNARPSALDSPRFFDDAPLSGWKVGEGAKVAASKQRFAGARAYTRSKLGDKPVPDAPQDAEPLPIELVRGANGPSDENWTVVVDGLRNQLTALPDGTFLCKLPRGVSFDVLKPDTKVRPVTIAVRLEAEAETPLSADVQVMQKLISTERANSEEKESNEKAVGGRVPLYPYRTTDVVAKAVTMPYPFWSPAQSALGILSLKPVNRHRESEVLARAYNLAANIRNSAEKAAYDESMKAYVNFQAEQYVAGSVGNAVSFLTKLTGNVNPTDLLTKSDFDKYKLTIQKPRKPTQIRSRLVRPAPENDSDAVCFVIGGKSKSAVEELTEMFVHIANVCERMRKETKAAYEDKNPSFKKLSLRAHLGLMRVSLRVDVEGDEKTAALFDALMDVNPFPPARFLLNLAEYDQIATTDGSTFTYDDRKHLTNDFRRQYVVRDCAPAKRFMTEDELLQAGAINPTAASLASAPIGADADGGDADGGDAQPEVQRVADLGPKTRQRLNDENSAYLEEEKELMDRIAAGEDYKESDKNKASLKGWGGKDFAFVYDRLTLEQRRRTLLATSINVHIVNFDGSDFKVRFEAEELDGIVAHAVYSEYRKQIDDFDIASEKLVSCLFDIHAQDRSPSSRVKDSVAAAFQALTERVFLKYAFQKQRVRSPLFGSVFDILKYVSYGQFKDLSSWLIKGFPFTFDPCQTEERIAELRIMAREILPIWPPLPKRDPVEPLIPDPESVVQTNPPASGAPPNVSSAQVGPEPSEQPTQPATATGALVDIFQVFSKGAERAAEQRRDEEQMKIETEKALKRRRDEADALANEEAAVSKNSSAVYPELSREQQETRLVVRQLPQIVIPGAALQLNFLGYEFDDRSQMVPVNKSGDGGGVRWISWVIKEAAPLAIWATAAFLGYEAYAIVLRGFKDVIDEQMLKVLFPTFAQAGAELLNVFTGMQTQTGSATIRALAQVAGQSLSPLNIISYGNMTANDWWDAYTFNAGAIPFASNLASWILTLANRKTELSKRYHASYDKMQQRLLNRPGNSAVASGRAAIKKLRDAASKLQNSLGVADGAAVVYNDYNGSRFTFYEYYEFTDELSKLANVLPLVHEGAEWTSVPDGNAMRLFPPLDVADQIYETEVLRGIPVAKTTGFTAGTTPALSAATPAELAAKAAHQELMQIVRRARRVLQGEHLMQSAGSTALELSRSAAEILRAVYGLNAGVTLVDGNDIVWTCLRGGVAARLAVRHLSLFDEAQMSLLPTEPNSRVQQTLLFWRGPRRAVVDAFAKAFVEEANNFFRQEKPELPRIPMLRELSIEAARTFARANALIVNKPRANSLEKTTLLAVVASSMAHGVLLNASLSESSDKLYAGIATMVALAEVEANAFSDQSTFEQPKPTSYGSSLNEAAWASRRLAPSLSRSLPVGIGAQDIVKKLSALSVSDSCGADAITRTYYCPMGSRIEAVPSSVPFAVDNLGSRIVWMQVLEQKALALSKVVRQAPYGSLPLSTAPESDGALFIDTVLLSGKQKASGKLSGMGRHPLALQQSGAVILVPTSATPPPLDVQVAEFSDSVPSTLLEASRWLQNGDNSTIPLIIRSRVKRMRTVAFNAERLMFSLALGRVTASCAPRVEVRLRSADHVASFALALAMLEVEMGSLPAEMTVYVNDVEEARSYAEAIAAQTGQAFSSGCRVCSLAEAALCL